MKEFWHGDIIMVKYNIQNKFRDGYLCFFHILAIYCPFGRIKRQFYRMRGSNIGKNVDISMGVFMEESFPHLILIEDNVQIGPNVLILTHDSSKHCINPEIPLTVKKVIIKKNSYIGAGAIILPGITIGEQSIIGAGTVVTKDIPPFSIVKGVPGRITGRNGK